MAALRKIPVKHNLLFQATGQSITSKNAVSGQLFECRFNFSDITFCITKVSDVVYFCDVGTGEEYCQNKTAFDAGNFIAK